MEAGGEGIIARVILVVVVITIICIELQGTSTTTTTILEDITLLSYFIIVERLACSSSRVAILLSTGKRDFYLLNFTCIRACIHIRFVQN